MTECEYLENAFDDFGSVSFFLVESDSSDNSLDVLNRLAQVKENFSFVSMGSLKKHHPKRTDRIAVCRNRCLEELDNNPIYKGIDLIVVADFDGVNTLLNKEAVRSCWEITDWDVCTANQKGTYYDVWALRHNLLCPNDWNEVYRFLTSSLKMGSIEAKKKTMEARLISIPKDSDPIEVESAFGGLAIYKRKSIEGKRYSGLTETGEEICEHVPLHQQMRNSGSNIYINPKMVNCVSPLEHVNVVTKNMLVKHAIEHFFPFLLRGIPGKLIRRLMS